MDTFRHIYVGTEGRKGRHVRGSLWFSCEKIWRWGKIITQMKKISEG